MSCTGHVLMYKGDYKGLNNDKNFVRVFSLSPLAFQHSFSNYLSLKKSIPLERTESIIGEISEKNRFKMDKQTLKCF